VERAIDQLVPRGTTDLYDGLAAGFNQVLAQRVAGVNRIVLLSDGVPNTSAQLPALIAQIRTSGLSVTSLGLGIDYDTTLMTQIARDTGGRFHYIAAPDEVAKVFDDELGKMSTVIGRNLVVSLTPGPGVTVHPIPGLVANGGRLQLQVGDLAAGETRDLMVPIAVAARRDGSTAELIDATLRFEDVIGGSGMLEREAYVGVPVSSDAATVAAGVVPELEVARVRALAAAAIVEAMAAARRGDQPAAKKRLAEAAAAVRAAIARYHDAGLSQVLDELDEVGKQLAQVQLQTAPPGQGAEPVPQPGIAPAAVEPVLRRAEERAGRTLSGER
ncbi:MAG TPA: VWA domain-containing protein, partial [Kofleriaceae bacterium]|nr:VWA domain-containing protein [Kofleriaceae bacterium]